MALWVWTEAQQKRMSAERKVRGIIRLSGPNLAATNAGTTRPAIPTPLMIRINDAADLLSIPIMFFPKDPSYTQSAQYTTTLRTFFEHGEAHIEHGHPHPQKSQEHSGGQK